MSVSQSTVQGSAELFDGGKMLPSATVNCWAVWEDFLGEAGISKHRSSFRDEFRRATGTENSTNPPHSLSPHCLDFPSALSVLTSSAGRKEAEVEIYPHSSQMRRNCLQGKKNNINPIVSAPRSCLKNKNNLKLQLGRFSLAKHWTRLGGGPVAMPANPG